MRAWWFVAFALLAGCSSSAWENLTDPLRDAIRQLDLAEREAARGRDVYASIDSGAGAWRVRCAWDAVALQGACVLRTRVGADDLLMSSEDSYVALVGDDMDESRVADGGDVLVARTCVKLSTGRHACLWTRDAAMRIAAALEVGNLLHFVVRTAGQTREVQPSSEGYATAERAYTIEMRAMRVRQSQKTGGGGGGSM